MLWIRFDEEDRWSPAPPFCLPSIEGEQVCLSDFRGNSNLVLFFIHNMGCRPCLEVLKGFAEHQAEYQAEDARVVVIFPEPIRRLADDPELSDLPVVLLSDLDGTVRTTYASLMDESLVSNEDNLIFVLDQYGAPYTAVVGRELDEATLHEEIIRWLRFVGMQCPE